MEKRLRICDELTSLGIICTTPERADEGLDEETKKAVPAPMREIELFRQAECIVVLSTKDAIGAAAELGQLHALGLTDPTFHAEVLVLHLYKYLPTPTPPEDQLPYLSSVVQGMPHRIAYSSVEFDECSLVASCISRVQDLRWAHARTSTKFLPIPKGPLDPEG